jgi:predicted unusual protein kinase regulating ubiquinone biosynthesis (AarF/ABC1/UbiB family)
LIGALGRHHRSAIAQVILAALVLDAGRIVGLLQSLGESQSADPQILKSIVQRRLRDMQHGTMPSLTWLIGVLDEAVQTARLRVGADLMMFRKSLYTLEGVLAELGAGRVDMDGVLLADFISHFAMEWPRRCCSPPNCRHFSTHLSTSDLLRAALSCGQPRRRGSGPIRSPTASRLSRLPEIVKLRRNACSRGAK